MFYRKSRGELVSVENIVPPGSDAHTVEVKTNDMVKLAESDAFIYSGTRLEEFADSVIDAIEPEGVPVVNATENIEFMDIKEDANEEENPDEHSEEEAEDSHDEHGSEMNIDPHVWLDPNRSITVAENIKNALVELSPENETVFEENFSALKSELEQLDGEFKDMADSAENKTFLVSHSAYGYWEEAYGLKQIGISGLSPTDEPSQSELVEVIKLAKENNLKHIFFEPNLTNKIAEMVQNETDTATLVLYNLESISEENIKAEEDYFNIMRKNKEALEQGLTQ